MTVGEVCNRDVVVVDKAEPIVTAARLMREHHVGTVVVVEGDEGAWKPIGIVTDRDLVLEVLAEEMFLGKLRIGDLTGTELITLRENADLLDAIKLMRDRGVRRAPIVDELGFLVGILSVDDVIDVIAEQLSDIVGVMIHGQRREQKRAA
jgi:CBS domain-containing protein